MLCQDCGKPIELGDEGEWVDETGSEDCLPYGSKHPWFHSPEQDPWDVAERAELDSSF